MGWGHSKEEKKDLKNIIINPDVKEPVKNVGSNPSQKESSIQNTENKLPHKESPIENIENKTPQKEPPIENSENKPLQNESHKENEEKKVTEEEPSVDDAPLIKTFRDPKDIKASAINIDQSNSLVFNIVKLDKIKTLEEDNNENAFTYLVKQAKTLTEFAYKTIDISDKSEENIKNIMKEIEIIKNLDHPNIIKIIETTISEDNKYLEILSEFAERGELQTRLEDNKKENKHFPEHSLLDWLSQTCFALAYLHAQNILHRNIKPSSIYLMGIDYAKLGNFGISNIKERPNIMYLAPELYEKKDYTKKTDIWYLGATFFQLMTFNFPFKGKNDEEIRESILKDEKNENNTNYRSEVKDLINRMLSKDPEERPSAADILLCPFVKKRMESFMIEIEKGLTNDGGKNDCGFFDELDEIEVVYINEDENDDKKEEKKEEKNEEIKEGKKEIKKEEKKEEEKEEKKEEKNKMPKRRIKFVISDTTENIKKSYLKSTSKSVNVKVLDPSEIKDKNEQIAIKKAKKNAFDLRRQMTNIRDLLEKNKINI